MAKKISTPNADAAPVFGRLSDFPISEIDQDCLGFKDLAKTMARRIKERACVEQAKGKRCDFQTVDTFGLFGSWGTGKSSILALTQLECEEKVIWIEFDALKYQTEEMLLIPLLHRLAEECGDEDAARFFWGCVKAVGDFAADVIVATSGVPVKKQAAKLIATLKGIPAKEKSPAAKLPKSRARAIEDAFSSLVRLLRKKHSNKRLVIAIDNLDRCRPPALLELIEAIHLLLTTNNVTFILAMDQAATVRCIHTQYGFSISESALYLEKMIPDYFRVPDPWVGESYKKVTKEEDAILKYLRYLFDDFSCKHLEGRKELLWEVIGSATILRNPRRIKRLLRRLSSFTPEWWRENSKDALATLFLCLVSDVWPGLYSAIPITEPKDWKEFIRGHIEAGYKRKAIAKLDEWVDSPFQEFLLALSQWDKDGTGFERIQEYDKLDQLLGEMRQLGL